MTIGERIKFFRKSRGITQSQLAKLSGVHPVSVRKYETNKMVPQPEQIRRIADALAVSYYA
ncbi:MAG: helix-turn-helix transcriptional regulator, partial [Oscillospiraceae bacterium]|nr:helix-turn-helix transcriptional regulator [Oscillospiraceae bacterium]